MRGILFKGQRKGNKEWIEGYYAIIGIRHVIIKAQSEDYYSVDNSLKKGHGNEIVEVDPETVCQYTGLTDKNGRKIFEGDILSGERYHDWGQGGEYEPDKCIIKWNEKRAAFSPVYWWEGYNHDLKHYEVVGNIFDNPGILEAR